MGERSGVAAWAGVVLVTLCGALSALLETLLVPLYAGGVVVPVAAVFAVLLNVALPLLARAVVPNGGVAALPFLAWLVVVIGFGIMARPEGDVILPGAPDGAEWVTWAVVLLGALAGAATLVATAGGRPAPPRQAHQAHQGAAGTNPAGGASR